MSNVVGVRFKAAGKIYAFDGSNLELKSGDRVIVETENGLCMGLVAVPVYSYQDAATELKKVLRVANEDDFKQREKNAELEKKAYDFCLKCIKELKLVMNLFTVDCIFDGTKLTFFFTAEGRVDFRQLVKMLVKEFRVRIEMRQVGIRNQAKMLSGVGKCGREVCCATFLEKFDPVSIRMAKDQDLSLNPTKISGLCGRLMCCLTFENETYKSIKADYPKVGRKVNFTGGSGRVVRHNVMCGRVIVSSEEGVEREIKLSDIISEDDTFEEIKEDEEEKNDSYDNYEEFTE
ncbi:MAG: stage 0 sporulation protein [Desulfobacterales bacterium]|nr:stage 0 sporulation protein [Desulfobacterales bacterium]MBF0397035.1 stage 0 sporulation protein [Desulfobacterales bacterium]